MNEEKIVNYMLTKQYIEGKYTCWEFVQDIFRDEYGMELPDYPMGEVQAEFKNKVKSNFNHIKVDKKDAKEGDMIVFSAFANQHAGVMLDNDNFIHLGEKNVMISQLSNIGGNYAIYRAV